MKRKTKRDKKQGSPTSCGTGSGQTWRGRKDQKTDELALLFSAGRDVLGRPPVDESLIPFDLWNTEAHNIMLWRRRIIGKSDLGQILSALETIRRQWNEGKFHIDPALEDVHMNIEARVSETIGPRIGGQVHTGRSRNDQVACDMRMYLREQLLDRSEDAARLALALVDIAAKHLNTVMPGHTHRRPATVTTVAHWLASHAQALLRDLERMRFAYHLVNRCPLGAAAAYGTSWPIDRELTAQLLGFDSVQENTLDCISNRWESEAEAASAVVFLLNHCSALAQDLIGFSMQFARWIALPDAFTTGSSIMPQKRNPDFAEIALGKAAAAQGMLQTLLGLGRGLPAGYNRETQIGKQTVVELFQDSALVPEVLARVVREMKFDSERLYAAATQGYLNAVDFADELVRSFGLSFREAYGVAARAIGGSGDSGRIEREAVNRELAALGVRGRLGAESYRKLCSPQSNMERRKHLGGPAPASVRANLKRLKASLGEHRNWLSQRRSLLAAARTRIEEIRKATESRKSA